MNALRLSELIPKDIHNVLKMDDHPTPDHVRNILQLARTNPRFEVSPGVEEWFRTWVETRPAVQERGFAALAALQERDRELILNGQMPAWRLEPWAEDLMFPWGEGYDDAVAKAEALL